MTPAGRFTRRVNAARATFASVAMSRALTLTSTHAPAGTRGLLRGGITEPGGKLGGGEVENDVSQAVGAEGLKAREDHGALVFGERAVEAAGELAQEGRESPAACPVVRRAARRAAHRAAHRA